MVGVWSCRPKEKARLLDRPLLLHTPSSHAHMLSPPYWFTNPSTAGQNGQEIQLGMGKGPKYSIVRGPFPKLVRCPTNMLHLQPYLPTFINCNAADCPGTLPKMQTFGLGLYKLHPFYNPFSDELANMHTTKDIAGDITCHETWNMFYVLSLCIFHNIQHVIPST